MEKPMCLIENSPNNKLEVKQEGTEILLMIQQPWVLVAVVVVLVGLFWTRKYFLMKKLTGEKKDFSWHLPLSIMEAPMCLIENKPNEKLQVNPEALEILQNIQQPVVVVAIVGLYRTGKSYLMNKLAGQKKGFPLGATVQANTKGIWMWCLPHPIIPDRTLVLLDTEGLGNVEKGDTQNDTWIFALAVLLSSTLVYNSTGTIDQNVMDRLHYVTELTECIKVKAPSGQNTEGLEDSAEFVRFFPNFIWALRDFTLQLELNGCPITEDEYLENALKLKKGDTQEVELFNMPRKCIRFYFPHRKCFTFGHPTKAKNMHRLEDMKESELDPDFVEHVGQFGRYVYEMSKEKTIPGGHIVTGRLLAKLAESYVESICSGKVPCMENAVLVLAEMENSAALGQASARYVELMEKKLTLPTETTQQLLEIHAECEKEALRVFMDRSFKDDTRHFQAKFMKTIEEKKELYCHQNELESRKSCEAVLTSLSQDLDNKVQERIYSRPDGYKCFVADLKKVEERYHQEPRKGIMAEAVLQEFLKKKEDVGRTILQSDKNLTEKEKEMAEAKAKAEAAERERELQKQQMAEQQQKMEDLKRSYEMNRQELEEKMKRERELLLEEQQKMIESKLAEEEALLISGLEKEARRLNEEIQHLQQESAKIKELSWLSTLAGGLFNAALVFIPMLELFECL
ncbi:guanylate-binding protein 3-like isoform X2 [Pogona vitticeps]